MMGLNVSKSIGPDDMLLRVLKKMPNVVANTHSIIFKKSCLSGEVHSNRENIF